MGTGIQLTDNIRSSFNSYTDRGRLDVSPIGFSGGRTCDRQFMPVQNPSAPTISLGNIRVPFRPTAVGTLNNTASIKPGVTMLHLPIIPVVSFQSTVVSDVAITKSVSQAGNLGLNSNLKLLDTCTYINYGDDGNNHGNAE